MRKLLIALLGATTLSSAAGAADLPSRYAPPPSFVAVPVFTWTGFYVGVNAGYGWGSNRNSTSYGATAPYGYYGGSGSNGGFVGGGQVGYNYQFTPGAGLVVGVEADLQYADLGRKYAYGSSSSGNYFGTVRGRLGYAFDRFLVYGTGGFAYGDVGGYGAYAYPLTTASPYYSGGRSETNGGWTLGGGVEYAFTHNLTAKVEGLYVSLNNGGRNAYAVTTPVVYGANQNRAEFGVVRAGLNYKF